MTRYFLRLFNYAEQEVTREQYADAAESLRVPDNGNFIGEILQGHIAEISFTDAIRPLLARLDKLFPSRQNHIFALWEDGSAAIRDAHDIRWICLDKDLSEEEKIEYARQEIAKLEAKAS